MITESDMCTSEVRAGPTVNECEVTTKHAHVYKIEENLQQEISQIATCFHTSYVSNANLVWLCEKMCWEAELMVVVA